MAKLTLPKASTGVSTYIFIQDASSTTGAGLTGLTFSSASLVAYYVRPLSSACPISLASQTPTGAFVSGGFTAVSGSMPGLYRFDLPNAVCATNADNTIIMLYGAADMLPVLFEIQLTDFDLNTSASEIVDMIWDEELTGHSGSATAGSALSVSTASAVWNYSNRSITNLGTALAEIPSAVWNYVRRSLTPPTEYTTEYAAEHEILCMRGDTLTYVFEDIPVAAGYKNVYVTVKDQYKDLDSQSLLQISSASGLIYQNGIASTSGSGATVTVDVSAQTVTIQVDPWVTQGFEYLSNGYVYDLQIIDASDIIDTPVSGAFTVLRDVTRAIT